MGFFTAKRLDNTAQGKRGATLGNRNSHVFTAKRLHNTESACVKPLQGLVTLRCDLPRVALRLPWAVLCNRFAVKKPCFLPIRLDPFWSPAIVRPPAIRGK